MTAIQNHEKEILTVMIFEEKKIELKDGRIAVFRTPEVEDAEKMLNYIKTACGETDFLQRYPEEWDEASIEGEEKWIKGLRDSQNSLDIACYIDGEIVGNFEISFRSGIKTSHRAGVGIAILKQYWNLGIGSAMFEVLISSAEARAEIQIVELQFMEGNDRARALYEKYGFKVVAERPNAFKLKDGRLLKEYFMQREIVRE